MSKRINHPAIKFPEEPKKKKGGYKNTVPLEDYTLAGYVTPQEASELLGFSNYCDTHIVKYLREHEVRRVPVKFKYLYDREQVMELKRIRESDVKPDPAIYISKSEASRRYRVNIYILSKLIIGKEIEKHKFTYRNRLGKFITTTHYKIEDIKKIIHDYRNN